MVRNPFPWQESDPVPEEERDPVADLDAVEAVACLTASCGASWATGDEYLAESKSWISDRVEDVENPDPALAAAKRYVLAKQDTLSQHEDGDGWQVTAYCMDCATSAYRDGRLSV